MHQFNCLRLSKASLCNGVIIYRKSQDIKEATSILIDYVIGQPTPLSNLRNKEGLLTWISFSQFNTKKKCIFDHYSSDFKELRKKDDTIPVYKRNLRTLAIEMYKISNNLSPLFMRDMMTEICVPYNTRPTTTIMEDKSFSSRCTKNVTMKFHVPKLFHMD